jgi:hypothetical protein
MGENGFITVDFEAEEGHQVVKMQLSVIILHTRGSSGLVLLMIPNVFGAMTSITLK